MQWWCFAQQEPWTWTWRPLLGVWVGLVLLVLAYRRLVWRSSADPESRKTTRWRRAAFATGVFLLWASLDWPLGPLGASYLASVHMSQFLAVGLAAPALLLLSLPPAAFDGLLTRPRTLSVLEEVTSPLSAFFILCFDFFNTFSCGFFDFLILFFDFFPSDDYFDLASDIRF